jgi:hypothetical protein
MYFYFKNQKTREQVAFLIQQREFSGLYFIIDGPAYKLMPAITQEQKDKVKKFIDLLDSVPELDFYYSRVNIFQGFDCVQQIELTTTFSFSQGQPVVVENHLWKQDQQLMNFFKGKIAEEDLSKNLLEDIQKALAKNEVLVRLTDAYQI